MLTEKDYCDYDTCVALKELGFPTKMTFVNEFGSIEIPINSGLIQLYDAQKWLREEWGFNVLVDHIMTEDGDWCYNITHLGHSARVFKSYEEALSEGIKEAVKILKEK